MQRRMYDKIIQGGRQRQEKPRNVEPMAGYRQDTVEKILTPTCAGDVAVLEC